MKSLAISAIIALVLPVCPAAFADEDTPLEEQMGVVGKSLKTIGRALKKDALDYDEAAKLVDKAIAALKKSTGLTPKMLEKMPAGAEKDKMLADYKERMKKTMEGMDALKKQIAAKDNAKIQEALDGLVDMKKSGHKKFIEEDE